MINMQDQQNHTNVQHTITTVIIIITASMIVSDIYELLFRANIWWSDKWTYIAILILFISYFDH